LLAGLVAGWATHPLDNVRGNAQMLLDRDPDKEFGLTGLQDGFDLDRILDLVGDAAGAPLDREARTGPVEIAPEPILAACRTAGDRLRRACARGERVVLATGHPVGLAYLYHELSGWLTSRGADVRTPAANARWRDQQLNHDWQVVYWDKVAMLSDTREPRHTHWPYAMHRILEEERPDLVLADHGFAGAAIEAGVETVSIADVNDPALLVARAQGRTEHVLVFDDHVDPNAYWPVFLALTWPTAS
jgi:histidinol phosphate phosphatase hisN-like protein